MSTSTKGAHILVYPIPGAGHIIPLLDLTHLLLDRGLKITVVMIPQKLPLLDPLISSYPSSQFQHLVFPVPEAYPPSKNRLIFFMQFLEEHHYPLLLDWFQSHASPPVAVVSDFLLGWTHRFACQVGVPRIVFSPSGALDFAVSACIWRDKPRVDHEESENVDALVSFPDIPNSPTYPWWQIHEIYTMYKEGDPEWILFRNCFLSNLSSWGILFNSFADLERPYIDHVKKEFGNGRVWAVGPILPPSGGVSVLELANRGGSSPVQCHEVLTWLDTKEDDSVVYVCFGSTTVLTRKQMDELATALEKSGVHFVFPVGQPKDRRCVSSDDGSLPDGFEHRVAGSGRGLVIKGWAPQLAILKHRAVGAFVTHCGWNSVLEGIIGGVVVLTWPMRADQFRDAQLLVDEMGVGIRIGEASRTIPESDDLARVLVESLEQNLPQRIKAKQLQEAALSAVEGGSSEKDLEQLVRTLNEYRSG